MKLNTSFPDNGDPVLIEYIYNDDISYRGRKKANRYYVVGLYGPYEYGDEAAWRYISLKDFECYLFKKDMTITGWYELPSSNNKDIS